MTSTWKHSRQLVIIARKQKVSGEDLILKQRKSPADGFWYIVERRKGSVERVFMKLLQDSLEFKWVHELRNVQRKNKLNLLKKFLHEVWLFSNILSRYMFLNTWGKVGAVIARMSHTSCVLSSNYWLCFERSVADGVKVEIVWTSSVALQCLSNARRIRRSVILRNLFFSISIISVAVAQLPSKISSIMKYPWMIRCMAFSGDRESIVCFFAA